MQREMVTPPGVFPPRAHYSHVARAGNTVYIAGQVGIDQQGDLVDAGDAEANTLRVISSLAEPRFLVEIEAVAVLDQEGFGRIDDARAMLTSPTQPAATKAGVYDCVASTSSPKSGGPNRTPR